MVPPCTQSTSPYTDRFLYRRLVVKLRLKSGFTSAILTTLFPLRSEYAMGFSFTVCQLLFFTTYPSSFTTKLSGQKAPGHVAWWLVSSYNWAMLRTVFVP